MPHTPGERAYTAWFQAAGLTHLVDWTQLRPDAQACWEAAAEAVLDAWLAQPRMETPPLDRGPELAPGSTRGQARPRITPVRGRRWTPPPLHTEDHSDA